MPAAIVIAIRLLIPFTILRWPLAGGVLCLVVDAVDVILVDALSRALGGSAEFGPFYAQIDKWLDTWYLAFELWVSGRWPESMLRSTVAGLFLWRLAGVIAFEITAVRPLLVVFPNLFENVYLYVQVARRFAPRFLPTSWPQLILVLVVLYIPKAIQEYILHFEELHPWQWLRDTVVRPILGEGWRFAGAWTGSPRRWVEAPPSHALDADRGLGVHGSRRRDRSRCLRPVLVDFRSTTVTNFRSTTVTNPGPGARGPTRAES